MNFDVLKKYCEENLSAYDISKITKKSPTTVRYWLKKYNLKSNKYRYWEQDVLKQVISESSSYNEALVKLGKNTSSGNYNSIKRNIAKYNINTNHFKTQAEQLKGRRRYTEEEVFTKGSKISRSNLKRRFIEKSKTPIICSICKAKSVWRNKPLILILDHINGINNDNRFENLRLVCPNCNSQLSTHCIGNMGV